MAITLDHGDSHRQLTLHFRPVSTLLDNRTFKEVKHPRVSGYRLTVAEWDDGSRAYLDTRGLLHLKSSREKLPEVTIVLCDGPLAGWCSDGRMFGEPYYLGDHAATEACDVYREVIDPFCRSLS